VGVRAAGRRGHPIHRNYRWRSKPLIGGVHDRVPVMLMSEDYDRWLGSTTGVDELRAMLKPYDPALMEAYSVNRAVNSVKNDTEQCIEPAAD
jgi:putative SOS response-associated peptidase YedK